MRQLYEYVLTETEMKPFIREVLVRCFYEFFMNMDMIPKDRRL